MTDVYKGSTSHTYYFELVDSSTGLPKTAIVYTDVTASYVRTRSARVAITPATLASASAAWSSGGFILVDDTNQPGVYRFDVPDAAFATGADEVIVTVKATGCRTQSRKFTLVNLNNQVAYAPNAAANADGGLPILSSSATTLAYTINTVTTYTGNTPQTADHTANIAAIVADTNELQTDWANGGRLDLILDARSSQTSVDDLPTNAELSTALGTADDAVLAAIAALNDITVGEVRTELAIELARIDVATSTRATPAQVATELGTYDAPTNAEMVAAFTEVKGATWATTDTLEAIRDRGDSAWITATGFSTHSAADVRTELAVELARIDAAVSTRATPAQVATELGTYDAPTKAELDTAIDALPTAAENAAALMDLADGIETSITLRQAVRLILAASAGELSGAATTTITIRNVGDTKDRITATVDSSGNRSAVVVDGT